MNNGVFWSKDGVLGRKLVFRVKKWCFGSNKGGFWSVTANFTQKFVKDPFSIHFHQFPNADLKYLGEGAYGVVARAKDNTYTVGFT